MKKQLRCVIYTRVSTEKQAQGLSLDVQAAACRHKATDGLQGVVVGLYVDAGTSGATYSTRVKLQQAIAEIETGRADRLVCYDVSRLSRDPGHLDSIAKRVRKANGDLAFVNGDFANDANGNMMLGMNGVLASWERTRMGEKSWEVRLEKVKSGVQTQRSVAPYGLKVINKHDVIRGTHTAAQMGTYELVEADAKVVRLIFELYAAGNSLREICRQLQNKGIETPKGCRTDSKVKQRIWLPSTLKTIMSNKACIGKASFGKTKAIRDEGRIDEGFKRPFKRVKMDESKWHFFDCPPIVEKSLFDYCNAQMKLAQERHSGPTERQYMLGGIMYCAKCDRTMMVIGRRRFYAKGEQKEWIYKCKNATRIGITKDFICNPKVWKGHIIEAQVTKVLHDMAAKPAWIEQAYDNFQDALDNDYDEFSYQELKKGMAALDAQETNVLELQLRNMAVASQHIFEKKFTEIAKARTELQAKLARFEEMQNAASSREDISEQAEDLSATLDAVSKALSAPELAAHEKHSLVSTVIEKITADEHGKFVITFRPFAAGTVLTAIVNEIDIQLKFVEQENW